MDENNFIEQIIDWDKFDASSQISRRINGVTKEHIVVEVKLWEKQLSLLDPLNYDQIMKEIDAWDISVPSTHALTQENIAATYAKLVSYKVRVSKLWADAKAWREVCETAVKYIEELSQGAFTGTAVEKKANASHVVQPFVHLRVQTSRIENYLDKIHSSITFCAQQLDLLLKERQSRAKLNFKLGMEGEQILTETSQEELVEENGEVWKPVRKNYKR
jgi:hypothetical protein